MPEHVKEKLRLSNKGKKQSIDAVRKRADALRGPKNPLWKGNRPLVEKIRKCFEYTNWRTMVFQRDEFKCIICLDSTGGNLNADHIVPFSFLLNENKIESIEQAIKCESLWDINNGRTLCVECHKKTDTYGELAKKYGKQQ
jgi:5-methylcytosine-specific restriction endonuclease McrA